MAVGLTLAAAIALLGASWWPNRAAAGQGAGSGSQPGRSGYARPAVVVEMFTSQGCSSCPPADRLMSELARAGAELDVDVVPLAFHVDYWNYIGWTDPFSSAAWTDRQRDHARALDLDTIYTPQAVVDGWLECVGSDRRDLRDRIERAAEARRDGPEMRFRVESSGENALDVVIAVGPHPSSLDLFVAIFENGLVTEVGRGENAERTLTNDAVVRSLDRIERGRFSRTVTLDPAWDRGSLGLAVFARDRSSGRIVTAGSRELPPVSGS